jgi:ketosteroid isomerase-like protein
METTINDPEVAAEIAALHAQYEEALVKNNVEKLVTFFWDSPHALRFGVSESLYGAKAIEQFRSTRPPTDLAREVSNLKIMTFGRDCAIVTFEFAPSTNEIHRSGRQSQVWRRFEDGWKIVSAHVSFVPVRYVDLAAPLIRLPMPLEHREGVQQNVERAAANAKPLLDLTLDESVSSALVFQP